MSHDDFAFEPIRGLPAVLPEGEMLLWQGVPQWWSLAVRGYHVRKVAMYFMAIVMFRIAFGIGNGQSSSSIMVSCAFLMTLGGAAIGVLSLLAYFNAASTVYSITSRRVLLRHGIAVPLTMNIPFALIESAAIKNHGDATGDISLRLARQQRIGYLVNWPHLRPGHITHPQPSFRALLDAQKASAILGEALIAGARTASVTSDAASVANAGVGPSPVGPRRAAAA